MSPANRRKCVVDLGEEDDFPKVFDVESWLCFCRVAGTVLSPLGTTYVRLKSVRANGPRLKSALVLNGRLVSALVLPYRLLFAVSALGYRPCV